MLKPFFKAISKEVFKAIFFAPESGPSISNLPYSLQVRQRTPATSQDDPRPLRARRQEGVPAQTGGVHDLPDDAGGAQDGGEAQEEVPQQRGLPLQEVRQHGDPGILIQ